MVFYFYSRISTVLQNSARQIETFKSLEGFDPSRLFVERIQGNIPFMERSEAVRMFDELTNQSERFMVLVDSTDRLGRNLIDILHTILVKKSNPLFLTYTLFRVVSKNTLSAKIQISLKTYNSTIISFFRLKTS